VRSDVTYHTRISYVCLRVYCDTPTRWVLPHVTLPLRLPLLILRYRFHHALVDVGADVWHSGLFWTNSFDAVPLLHAHAHTWCGFERFYCQLPLCLLFNVPLPHGVVRRCAFYDWCVHRCNTQPTGTPAGLLHIRTLPTDTGFRTYHAPPARLFVYLPRFAVCVHR